MAVARGPFPQELNKQALFRARLDMHAGEIKSVKEVDSVKAELPLLVYQDEAPDVYKMADDDAVEIGPFVVRHLSPHSPPSYQNPSHNCKELHSRQCRIKRQT